VARNGAARRRTLLGRISRLLSALAAPLGALALVTAVILPINQLTQPGGEVPVRLKNPDAIEWLGVPGLAPASWLSADQTTVTYHVFHLPGWLRALTEAAGSLTFLTLGLALLLIWRLLDAVGRGRPFDPRNPRRLRYLALLAAVGGLGSQLIDKISSNAVLRHVGMTGVDTPVGPPDRVDVAPVLLAVVLLAVADAFRRGRELSEDVEGLV
jgi:hypothetical protein